MHCRGVGGLWGMGNGVSAGVGAAAAAGSGLVLKMRFSKPCHQPTFYYHTDYHSALRPVIARNSPHDRQHSSALSLAPSLLAVVTPQNLHNRIYAKKQNMQTLPA